MRPLLLLRLFLHRYFGPEHDGRNVNIVVLFSLILVAGMLVDGVIVTTEYADRRIAAGLNRRDAYRISAQRIMADHFLDRNDADGISTAAGLAGDCRPVHEVSANHGDERTNRVAVHGPDFHSRSWWVNW